MPEAEESLKAQAEAVAKTLHAGETGQFPQGKLTDSDEGELRIVIGSLKGKVVLAFGKSITWIGLDPRQARGLADMIRDKAWAAMAGREDADPRTPTP